MQSSKGITVSALIFTGAGYVSPVRLPLQEGVQFQVINIGWGPDAMVKVPVNCNISSALAYISHSKPSCQYLVAGTAEKLSAVLSIDPRIIVREILLLRGVPQGSFASCSILTGIHGVETCLFPQGSFCPEAIKPDCVDNVASRSAYQIINDTSRLYRCPDGVSIYTASGDIHAKDKIEHPGVSPTISAIINLIQPGQSVSVRGSLGGYYCARMTALGMKLQVLEHVPQMLKLLEQNAVRSDQLIKGSGLNMDAAKNSYDATAQTNALGAHDISKLAPDGQPAELWYDGTADLHILRGDYLSYFGIGPQTRKRPVIIWGKVDPSTMELRLTQANMAALKLQDGAVLAIPSEGMSEFVQAFGYKLNMMDRRLFWDARHNLSLVLISSGSWPLSIIQAAKNLGWGIIKVFISSDQSSVATPPDVKSMTASEVTLEWVISTRSMLAHLFEYAGPPISLPNRVRIIQTDSTQFPEHSIAAPGLDTKLTLEIMRQMEQVLYRP